MENVSFSDTKVQDDQKIFLLFLVNTDGKTKSAYKEITQKSLFHHEHEANGPCILLFSMQKACMIFKNTVFIKQ